MSGQPAVGNDMAVTVAASSSGRRAHLLRNLFGVAVLALALAVLVNKRHDLTSASHILARLDWRWLVLALGAEAASPAGFAPLQRWLPRAGGVCTGPRPRFEISLACAWLRPTRPGAAAAFRTA